MHIVPKSVNTSSALRQRDANVIFANHWLQILLLAAVYLATSLLSRFFVISPEILAPVWIPAGVLLAGLLWLPWSAMLPAFMAVFLASVGGNLLTHVPLMPTLAFSFANCVGGFLGAIALKRLFGPRPQFGQLRPLVLLMVVGAGLANAFGAVIGALVVSRFGYGPFDDAWIIWFLSNAWGILIVVPLVMEWNRIWQFIRDAVPQAWVELLLITTMFSGIAGLIWVRHGAGNTYAFVGPFLIFPLLVWGALRFGIGGAIGGSSVVTALLLFTTAHGLGRFAYSYESLHTRFVELQVFMTMATACSLIAAAVISDRERAEQTLRYASSIIQSSDAAIIGKTLDGIITSWNPGAELLYGYTAQEVIGRPIAMLVPDDHSDEMPSIMARLARGEQTEDYETARRRKDGTRIDVALKVSPIFDRNGVLVGASSIARDITERKRAEQALQETNERLELSFGAAYMGAWDWDFTTGELHWYGKQEALFGIDPGTFDNRIETCFARIHPDDRARVSDEIRRWAAEKRADYTQEFRVVRPDGGEHWLFAKGRLVYEGGEAKRCLGINLDITERKLAEKALHQSEERLAKTQELSLIMPVHVSLQGEWLKVPPRYCDFLGYTHDELVGQSFEKVTHPDDFWADWSQCVRVIKGEINSFEMEKRFLRKDGSIVWGYINCSIVKDEAGNPVHFLTYVRDINQEKRTDEALKESEEALRTVVDSVYDGILLHTSDGTILDVNERFLQMYGLERLDVKQITVAELSGASNPVDQLRTVWDRVLAGESQFFEWKARRPKNDSLFDVDVYLRRVRIKGREVILANIRDITERKRAEDALRQSEELFRTTFENAAVGMAQVALDGRWLRVNERLCEIVGYTREEMEHRCFQDITHPDDLAADVEQARRLARGESDHYSMEKRYIHKNGRIVWVNLTVGLQAAVGDQPAYFISAVEDITERKRAEQELQKSELRFRVLSEALPQLVWTADVLGNVDYVNTRWSAYTGQRREEALGTGSFAAVHPDDLPALQKDWLRAVKTGVQHEVEFRLRNREGQYRWFLARGVPLHNEQGHVERWFGTCTDIHELKMAQEALIRSEKLASVGRMAMTIAHEINNPLAAVMNILFLVRTSSELPRPLLGHLDLADGELKRISHITRQALGFYRESTSPKPTSVNVLLESVTELLKSKIKSKHVRVEKDWNEEIQITAVSGELRQVFSNLISNCVDALDEKGRIKLRVSTSRAVPDGQRTVRIIVADNGRGISAKALPHIFEPFFTTKDAVGTGLGLWVSKQIIDKHKGCIRVRSRTDGHRRGTVFSVVLPIEQSADSVPCPQTAEKIAS